MNAARWLLPALGCAVLLCGGCLQTKGATYLYAVAGRDRERAPRPTPSVVPSPAVAPRLSAGWADDNAQYNCFLNYLDRFSPQVEALKLDVADRVVFRVIDEAGRSVPNCPLTVRRADGLALCRRRTYADGRAMFFPSEKGPERQSAFDVEVEFAGKVHRQAFDLFGPRSVEIRLPGRRPKLEAAPLDVAFLIDTTGSMRDEIEKLKQTLAAIQYQISQMTPRPDARFAMVLYRDRGDAYVTRTVPFTGDFEAFAAELRKVSAAGGGDGPEDVQEALRVAAQDLAWRPAAVKMAFLLADAPPHLDYREKFTYLDYARFAAGAGVKTTAIGASGLPTSGEYVFRQIAQYTMGLFVFLTYGETAESSADARALVSHHTGDNFQSRNLDAIIVQSVRRELAYLGDAPVPQEEDFFEGAPVEGVADRDVLAALFAEGARQLVDFSQSKLAAGTTAAVLPTDAAGGCAAAAAEAAGDQLAVAMGGQGTLKLVERARLQALLDEMEMASLPMFDQQLAPRRDRQLPAEVLVLSKLRPAGGCHEMFVKMVRVDSGEVLSATLLKIDNALLR